MKLKTLSTIAIILMVIGILGVLNSDKSKPEGMIAFFIGLGCLVLSAGIEIYIWSKKGWKWGFKWNAKV